MERPQRFFLSQPDSKRRELGPLRILKPSNLEPLSEAILVGFWRPRAAHVDTITVVSLYNQFQLLRENDRRSTTRALLDTFGACN